MRNILEPARKIPVLESYDVVVCGGRNISKERGICN